MLCFCDLTLFFECGADERKGPQTNNTDKKVEIHKKPIHINLTIKIAFLHPFIRIHLFSHRPLLTFVHIPEANFFHRTRMNFNEKQFSKESHENLYFCVVLIVCSLSNYANTNKHTLPQKSEALKEL
jgi:hypothetical protein